MRPKVRFILTLACLLVTSCSSFINTPQPTATASRTPTQIPTITPFPTFTPEPTATFTPTETPLPQIDLSKSIVWGADGNPVLSPWGTVKIETTKGFDVLPSIVDLEKQLGVPRLGWTPEFIRRWHASLMQATVNGVPVVPKFNKNTVCDITWYTGSSENSSVSFNWQAIKPKPCKSGTFPVAFVGGFTDSRPVLYTPGTPWPTSSTPLAGFTIAIWNPLTEKTELRTFVYSQHLEPGTNTFLKLGNEGAYYAPNYNIQLHKVLGGFSNILDWFETLFARTGIKIYDADAVNAALESQRIYADGLDETVLFGGVGVERIDHSSP